MPSHAAPLVLCLSLAACTSSPVAPLPQPLPENHGWEVPRPVEGGAFLGVRTRENLGAGFDQFDFPAGVRVARVIENSPAEAAGCRVEDVVLSLDGVATDDPGTLEALVLAGRPGQEVRLELQRDDQVFEVTLALGTRGAQEAAIEPQVVPLARLDPARSRAGWITTTGGVGLAQSHPQAPFPRAGVPVGSVVHRVNGEPVLSDVALVRALQREDPGARVEVEFTDPQGERRTRRVRLQDEERRITRCSLPILFGYSADADGEEVSFTLLDLWVIDLFHYERHGKERHYEFLSLVEFASGVGELSE